ncbi:MAG: phosphoenolpyruvate--protein phosphotransferase [Lachnospiraceae bacterium]|nr:phosphoenolpyruvate--protein phosphotransferase [Lachnospiraceae bacterium]
MERLFGRPVSEGIAIGRILFYYNSDLSITVSHISDPEKETARYHEAVKLSEKQIDELYLKAVSEIGEANARIIEVHKMILLDQDLEDLVTGFITKEKINAESAVVSATGVLCERLRAVEDPLFAERVSDIRDISSRIVRNLLGGTKAACETDDPYVLVAEDLNPSDIFGFDREKLSGLVIKNGSANSHVAILARSLGVPALVQTDIFKSFNGKYAVVDGNRGELIIDPTEELLSGYRELLVRQEAEKELRKKVIGQPDVTSDGKKILLYASINDDSDLDSVLKNDAAGIGLFRTEFLYLKYDRYPTEDEQFAVYRSVLEKMKGKTVVMRTCDIGLDKTKDYLELPKEANPALGYRGIRMSLDRPEIFITQMKAMLRAAAYGKLSVLYPMVISIEEIKRLKRLTSLAKEALDDEKKEYGQIRQGVMIETPAAALISDLIAAEVDFISVGTNDLTQYTLAVDRQNPETETLFDREHPAIYRLMKMTVDNGHKMGIPVGICGEIEIDGEHIRKLIETGFDEISVPPAYILPVRQMIRQSRLI